MKHQAKKCLFCLFDAIECSLSAWVVLATAIVKFHFLSLPLSLSLSLSRFGSRETAQKYAVQSMPTFLMLKKDKKVDELKGAGEDALRQAISRNV